MSSLTPELFARLHPVHHMIFDYLSQSSPYLVLRLNKYHRLRIIPDLYHTFTITTKSMGAFECALKGEDPLLPLAINHAKVLRVVNTESAISLEHFCPQDEDITVFPSGLKVVRVEFSWAVIRDYYFLRIQDGLGDQSFHRSSFSRRLWRLGGTRENVLADIPWLFGDCCLHINTTIVLHAPNHGQLHFPLGNNLPLPFESALRLVLWSKPERYDEIYTRDPRPLPTPSPGVFEEFAEFIAFGIEFVEDEWAAATHSVEEVLEEGFVYPLDIEVVCPNASHVEELARTLYRPNQRKAEGFDWSPRFRELNEEIVDHYDLWNRTP
ncbi:hypothetical protein I350_00076 [Cryptococcus amylolentus CBS 6273]|uniref:Uncharacterized protein n=1 Tax=Cryptococcus amylolentus CBS 6273 TaxID=1296118 RepID=A0A1E3KDY1_9TREE|nr:hypothetical protein I350_00076 [Cryptococcus amylolentus CBS 6273]